MHFRGIAVATFKHHTAPITSVEWNTRDSSVFAASGSDDQLTLWDLAVERDDDDKDAQGKLKDLPPQLLFIHMVCFQKCALLIWLTFLKSNSRKQ